MKIVIITTEPSGDFLGYNLIKTFKKKYPAILFSGVGGKLMESQGFKSWFSINEFSSIGIFEVLLKLFKFLRILRIVEKKIRIFEPNIIITIDSPSFNYRLIKNIQDLRKNNKTKIFHYVAPTVWAWKSYRAKIFSNLYDALFTLFDFEPKYFIKHGLRSKFVGHQIFYKKQPIKKKKKKICFLPGSRKVEIKNNLNLLKQIIDDASRIYHDFNFYILCFEEHENIIKKKIDNSKINLIYKQNEKQKVLSESFLAIAASGSVTLELAKYLTPMIVVYNTHFITKVIIKLFVKVKFASIVNIYFNKEVVPEFLFEDFNNANVMNEIKNLMFDKEQRRLQIKYLKKFSEKMQKKENPSDLILDEIERITKF